jgi:hypothetical protein
MHRLVKRTDDHLVIITYETRERMVCPPDPAENPELLTRLRPHTFGHFLKKHGLVPPNMMGEEYDEDFIIREEIEERKDPFKNVNDHEDDQTCFEISLVNKKNMALGVDCKVVNGEIEFGNVKVVNENGLNNARMTWVEKIAKTKANKSYKGPSF